MKKSNLIWLLVGGAAVYILFAIKRGSRKPSGIGDNPPPGTPTSPIRTAAEKKAADMTNEQLLSWYCRPKLGGPGRVMAKSREEVEQDRAVENEMERRKLAKSCPGYVGIKK